MLIENFKTSLEKADAYSSLIAGLAAYHLLPSFGYLLWPGPRDCDGHNSAIEKPNFIYYDPNRQLTQQLNIMLNQLFSNLVPYHFTASPGLLLLELTETQKPRGLRPGQANRLKKESTSEAFTSAFLSTSNMSVLDSNGSMDIVWSKICRDGGGGGSR